MIPASRELIAIIERNFESKSLDYKGPMSWDTSDKATCCGLVKDVLAFANTEGGYIVIGVSEADQGFELTGVTPEQAATFESSALCRFVQNYSDPPINVRVQKVEHQQKNFVVLEIPRFSDTPHLCQKDFPTVLSDRTLYVRTHNNESAPIKSSADFRAVIESAIRNRKDSLLSSFRAILTGTQPEGTITPKAEEQFQNQINAARKRFDEVYSLREKGYTFFIETTFIPPSFDQYRFLSHRLESAAHRASVSFTGMAFSAHSREPFRLAFVHR
jgi:predicted HTH transcriptional regulator